MDSAFSDRPCIFSSPVILTQSKASTHNEATPWKTPRLYPQALPQQVALLLPQGCVGGSPTEPWTPHPHASAHQIAEARLSRGVYCILICN